MYKFVCFLLFHVIANKTIKYIQQNITRLYDCVIFNNSIIIELKLMQSSFQIKLTDSYKLSVNLRRRDVFKLYFIFRCTPV